MALVVRMLRTDAIGRSLRVMDELIKSKALDRKFHSHESRQEQCKKEKVNDVLEKQVLNT